MWPAAPVRGAARRSAARGCVLALPPVWPLTVSFLTLACRSVTSLSYRAAQKGDTKPLPAQIDGSSRAGEAGAGVLGEGSQTTGKNSLLPTGHAPCLWQHACAVSFMRLKPRLLLEQSLASGTGFGHKMAAKRREPPSPRSPTPELRSPELPDLVRARKGPRGGTRGGRGRRAVGGACGGGRGLWPWGLGFWGYTGAEFRRSL